jgi:hypothetical protein
MNGAQTAAGRNRIQELSSVATSALATNHAVLYPI